MSQQPLHYFQFIRNSLCLLWSEQKKLDNCCTNLLGVNPVQCTQSFLKPTHKENPGTTPCLWLTTTIDWSPLEPCLTSRPNFSDLWLLQWPVPCRCNWTEFCLSCTGHLSLSAQSLQCVPPGKVTGPLPVVSGRGQAWTSKGVGTLQGKSWPVGIRSWWRNALLSSSGRKLCPASQRVTERVYPRCPWWWVAHWWTTGQAFPPLLFPVFHFYSLR